MKHMYHKLVRDKIPEIIKEKDEHPIIRILNDQEFDYVYKTIKNNYKFFLGNDYMLIFNEAKNFLRKENYDKILKLYLSYREKYQDIFK